MADWLSGECGTTSAFAVISRSTNIYPGNSVARRTSAARPKIFRDAFPAAVGFTDASWNPTEPAEVDPTSASKQLPQVAAVAITECTKRISGVSL